MIFSVFKPKCKHAFSLWEVIKRGVTNDLSYKIVQERRCALCGLTEVTSKWIG